MLKLQQLTAEAGDCSFGFEGHFCKRVVVGVIVVEVYFQRLITGKSRRVEVEMEMWIENGTMMWEEIEMDGLHIRTT